MKVTNFTALIQNIPHLQHSVDVKKSKWKNRDQKTTIHKIFGKDKVITISRRDLFHTDDLTEFVFKTLMWGYPTGGRGNNITRLQEENNLRKLVKLLEEYRNKSVTLDELKRDIKTIKGVNLSTMSKFLYFMKVKVNGETALILDQKIINVIGLDRFEELNSLKDIKYQNAIDRYVEYLTIVNKIANDMGIEPGQIELFLFMLGQNLKDDQ